MCCLNSFGSNLQKGAGNDSSKKQISTKNTSETQCIEGRQSDNWKKLILQFEWQLEMCYKMN